MAIETHVVTIVGNVAVTNISVLALMLSAWPLSLQLDYDSAVELCLFRKKVEARYLGYK